jgi:hypothetical protein
MYKQIAVMLPLVCYCIHCTAFVAVVACFNHLPVFIGTVLNLTNKRACNINYFYTTCVIHGRNSLSCIVSRGSLPCLQYCATVLKPEPFESSSYCITGVHTFWAPGCPGNKIFFGIVLHLWVLSVEPASCHASGILNFEVARRFL